MGKFKSYDDAVAALEESKVALKEAKEERKAYFAENKLKAGKPIEDPKILTKVEKLDAAIEKWTEKVDTIREECKELKPAPERNTKYDYPEGMSDVDKKKFRAKARRDSGKPEGEEVAEKPAKKAKEAAAEEAPVAPKKKLGKKTDDD